MQHVPKSGLVLRAMTTEDIPGGLRLCRASGWNQLEEDWRLFTDSPGSGGGLVEKAGDILGAAGHMRYDLRSGCACAAPADGISWKRTGVFSQTPPAAAGG